MKQQLNKGITTTKQQLQHNTNKNNAFVIWITWDKVPRHCRSDLSTSLDVDTGSFLSLFSDLADFFLFFVMMLMYFVHVYLVFCYYLVFFQ